MANIVTASFLFTLIQCMPDGNEGLYWHAGVVNYTWAFAFLLILTGLELSLWIEHDKKKRIFKTIAGGIMAVCVGGGNYITALQGCIWLFLIYVYMCWKENYCQGKRVTEILRGRVPELLLFIVVVVSFASSVLAPGNAVRIAGSTGLSPVKAVLVSFLYCLEVPFTQWLKWTFYVTLALAIPFMWKMLEEVDYDFCSPGIVAFLGYGITSAAFTPSLYAQASVAAGRLHDIAYFVFVLMVYVVLFYVLGWLQKNVFQENVKKDSGLSPRMIDYLMVLFLFLIVGSMLDGVINGNVNISYMATQSLVSGQAKEYKLENEERLKVLHDENIKNVVFESFTNPPELLFFEDITPNSGEWINDTMAVYYGKESVKRE